MTVVILKWDFPLSALTYHLQWRIQDFPWRGGGGREPRRGAWTPEAVMFRKFCMSNWKNLDPWGRARRTPPRSANALGDILKENNTSNASVKYTSTTGMSQCVGLTRQGVSTDTQLVPFLAVILVACWHLTIRTEPESQHGHKLTKMWVQGIYIFQNIVHYETSGYQPRHNKYTN